MVPAGNKAKRLLSVNHTTKTIHHHHHHHVRKLELHGFPDSSLLAYGCYVDIKIINLDGTVTTSLVTSRSRVSPMRNQTIPKLELTATLLLSRSIIRVKVELSVRFNVDLVFCWSDSMAALHWICGVGKHYGSFVQRRVAEIRSLVDHENFIDSGSSSAEVLSRGALLSNLEYNDLWHSGPKQVLYADTPPARFSTLCKDDSCTLLITDTPSTKKEELVNLNSIIDAIRFSSYLKLLRVTGSVMRFINRLANNLKNNLLNLHLVDSVELKQAEIL